MIIKKEDIQGKLDMANELLKDRIGKINHHSKMLEQAKAETILKTPIK